MLIPHDSQSRDGSKRSHQFFLAGLKASDRLSGLGRLSQITIDKIPEKGRLQVAARLRALQLWEHVVVEERKRRRRPKRKPTIVQVTEQFVSLWNVVEPRYRLSKTTLFRWRACYRRFGVQGLIDLRLVPSRVTPLKPIPIELWNRFLAHWLDARQLSVGRAWMMAMGELPEGIRSHWEKLYGPSLFGRRVKRLPGWLVVIARQMEGWSDWASDLARRRELMPLILGESPHGGRR